MEEKCENGHCVFKQIAQHALVGAEYNQTNLLEPRIENEPEIYKQTRFFVPSVIPDLAKRIKFHANGCVASISYYQATRFLKKDCWARVGFVSDGHVFPVCIYLYLHTFHPGF